MQDLKVFIIAFYFVFAVRYVATVGNRNVNSNVNLWLTTHFYENRDVLDV